MKTSWAALAATAGLVCATHAQAQQHAVAFTVPAQALSTALTAWAKQANRQIVFPYDAIADLTSAGLRGSFAPDVALRMLLANSGLEVSKDDGRMVVLRLAPTSAAAAAASEAAGGDILVTAQRRPERLRDVPISITAIGAPTIERARIDELQDLSRITPGLVVSNFSIGSPVIAIRGASNTFSQIGVDKPVGIVVDDVFIPRNSAATFQLFRLDSIQVLRGPQGTLFGKNVTGGAIVFDTGRPAFDQSSLRMRVTGGSYNDAELDAVADVAVSDDAAARIAFSVRRHDGWGRDRLTGEELDTLDSANLRGQLRFRLTDRLEALFSGDYAADNSGGRTLSSIGAGSDGNPRTAESGTPQDFNRAVYGASARLFLDTGPGQITSITAWRGSRSTDIYSNVAANYRFLTGTQSQALTDDRDHVSALSQEIRFASRDWKRGRFVAGLYLASDVSSRPLVSQALAARTGALVTNQLWQGRVVSTTAAAFVDGTLNLASFLSVTGGARYTWDRKEADLRFTNFLSAAGNFAVDGARRSWNQFTPRASIQLRPIASTMLYATYSRGYTAGGFNTQAATRAAFNANFQPETLDNFEAGIKTELLDKRVRINLDAFEMKYRNKQELYFNNLTRILNITNAGRARMRGVEAEVTVRPVAWATVTGTYGLLDTRYDQFVIPGGATLTGNRLGSAPKDKASAMLDIDAPLGPVRLVGNAVYSYTSQYFTGATSDGTLSVPRYALVNASLGLTSRDRRYSLSVFAHNLLDRDYVLIPSNQVVLGQYLGAPRTIGVSLGARF